MKILTLTISLLSFSTLAAEPLKLFYIQRSKNKNEVHYELLVGDNCTAKEKNPVHGYWQDLEKGPDVRSEIGTFEYIAYGISDQKIENEWIHFKMKAIENKNFKAKLIKKDEKCTAQAWTTFKGQEGILNKVYIFAVEGMIKPTVKYIDLFGTLPDGKPIQERLEF